MLLQLICIVFFMFEKYLTHVSNDLDRRNLARCRTSSHKLLIEYGRYTTPKTPVAERTCAQCPLKAIEDERHVLMICPQYVSHRFLVTKHLTLCHLSAHVVNRLLRENRKTITKILSGKNLFKNVTLQILNFIPVS